MTIPTADLLTGFTGNVEPRPLPKGLLAARADVLAAVSDLRTIPDDALTNQWRWKGGSEEEIRYGFYRIGEVIERAGIDAAAALGAATAGQGGRGRTADIVAPATATRWDIQGLLIPLDDSTWDADPGGEEWTIRQTLGHLIGSQRAYAVTTGWWQERAYRADDPDLPASAPEWIFDELPTDEAEAEGTRADVRDRLDDVVDRATERLAGLPADRLAFGARWSGFAVDIAFRMARWSSHMREHTIQVEKTLEMLDLRPTENDRLVRLVLAGWGRAEAVVYGSAVADDAVGLLAAAATAARETAAEIAGLAHG